MFCAECGFKINNGFKFCPNCGCEVINEQKVSEPSLDEVIKDVLGKYPSNSSMVTSELSKLTGLSKLQIGYLVAYVRDGEDLKRLKDYQAMERKYKSRNVIDSSPHCPKCGSHNIYIFGKEADKSTTVSYVQGIYDTTYKAGKTKARCRDCGKKWKF